MKCEEKRSEDSEENLKNLVLNNLVVYNLDR